ncbi:MAG: DUF1540 domain-containing protein [Oscillospiraceae bacterium]|nr:DUF1540 domain-containing protein [Oscillospiraceae bacterium]
MQNNQYGQQPIREITCTANQCLYNCSGNKCTAEHIIVDDPAACCPDDTCCATFEQR